MAQNRVQMQDPTKEGPAETEPGNVQQEPGESWKVKPYLTALPAALMKFTNLQRAKTPTSLGAKILPGAKRKVLLEGSFGLGPLVFSSCQRFNNINSFLALYCTVVLAQGIVLGLTDLSIINFEKDFYLSNTEKILLTTSYDLASLLVAILVAHFGHRGNRARWVAAAAFVVGLGSVSLAVPYLKYEIVRPVEESEELCIEEELRTVPFCGENITPHRSEIIYLFILGQFLQGFAGMPIYILGLTFIYDHVSTSLAGIYIGIGYAVQVLGYALAYIVGARNTRPSHNHIPAAEVTHSSLWWQMNWWAGFLSATALAWLAILPLLCFPSILPGANKIRFQKKMGSFTIDRSFKDKKFGSGWTDLFQALRCLFSNPLILCYAMSKATEALTFVGAAEFLPKYLENQFLLTPSFATLLTGIILIPGGAIGNFLGGFIVSKLKLSCKSQMKFILITSILSLLLLILIVFVDCETVKFAGINDDYDGSGTLGNLSARCNAHCGCTSSDYSSVCGRDETEYFSPCFAGCSESKNLNNEKTFYNCSCIQEGVTHSDTESDSIDAIPGKCITKCFTLPLFFAFFFSAIAFSGTASIPITLIMLQTLPHHLQSLGIGVTYTILRLFGSIPGPLLFQVTANNSCLYWDVNKCGVRGRCWIYDKLKMIFILMGLCISSKLATTLLILFAFLKYNVVKVDSSENLAMPACNALPRECHACVLKLFLQFGGSKTKQATRCPVTGDGGVEEGLGGKVLLHCSWNSKYYT
ncbi:solute carrier organic anion transporter family member 6A1 [Acomys russatus]|uniref:solute carrier organic anion transporter family member 6A1 n=1 Tax=Acomys russatus TaxID=60746 RepID=UPI0021E28F87|nr:solute carrier organic anion transporter family member 6A1 [Acomys russatus]